LFRWARLILGGCLGRRKMRHSLGKVNIPAVLGNLWAFLAHESSPNVVTSGQR
jgi:hypothetical protein